MLLNELLEAIKKDAQEAAGEENPVVWGFDCPAEWNYAKPTGAYYSEDKDLIIDLEDVGEDKAIGTLEEVLDKIKRLAQEVSGKENPDVYAFDPPAGELIEYNYTYANKENSVEISFKRHSDIEALYEGEENNEEEDW